MESGVTFVERTKRAAVRLFMFIFLMLAVCGCSGQAESKVALVPPGEKVSLTVAMYVTDISVQDVYYDIVDAFEKEYPSIEVNLRFPGFEYERILGTWMEENRLPDIMDTHGWSQKRYGPYLADLREESWVPRLTGTIREYVTDRSGKVYALPISEARDGITYHKGLLEKYGIGVPRTYDELIAAAETIKTESGGEVVPFFFAATDEWTVGQFFDYFANSLFVAGSKGTAKLLNGSFDWTRWTQLSLMFQELIDRKLINADVMTAKYSDLNRLFAEGKVAFSLSSPSYADEVFKINKETNIGIMPIPAVSGGSAASFSGGERNTMGIWKDSPHQEEAKRLLFYFAKPENLAKIEEATKIPSGLLGAASQHEFSDDYLRYAEVPILPYFDRTYLPYGMWETICKSGIEQLAGQITPEQFAEAMKTSANRLMLQ